MHSISFNKKLLLLLMLLSICSACDLGCDTCNGSECYTCSNGYYLYNSTCLTVCPSYYFGNYTERLCMACYTGCIVCDGLTSTSCFSCGVDDNGTQYYLTEPIPNTCTVTCPASYYSTLNPDYFICDKCASECTHCYQINQNYACTGCNNSAGYYFSFTSNTTCTTCQASQIALGSPLTCTPCDTSCLTCQNQTTFCLSCSSTFLYNNTCVTTCPDGFYGDGYNACVSCALSCLTCSGGTALDCTSCGLDNGTQMYLSGGACSSTCLTNYLNDTTGNTPAFQCDVCDVACTLCSAINSSASCQACDNAGSYYFSTTNSTSCVQCQSNEIKQLRAVPEQRDCVRQSTELYTLRPILRHL